MSLASGHALRDASRHPCRASKHPRRASKHPRRASKHTRRAPKHPRRTSKHPRRASKHPRRTSKHHAVRQNTHAVRQNTTPYVKTPMPCVKTPTPCVKTPTSCVKTPTPYVKTPMPCVKTPTPCVKTHTPCAKTPTPYVKTPTSCVKTPTPCVKTPTPYVKTTMPCVKTPTPCVKTPTPYVKTHTSCVKTPTPYVKTTMPCVKTPTPCVKTTTPYVKTPTPCVKTPTPCVKTPTPCVKTTTPYVKTPTPCVKTPTPCVKTPTPCVKTPTSCVKTPTSCVKTPTPYVKTPTPCVKTPMPCPTIEHPVLDQYLIYFYPTPYAAVLGNNRRIHRLITPSSCARKCLEEREFVCRSFDYQIQDGTCLLSTKTGSDVGGLYNPGLAEVHHFEMKPSLDCGGVLEGPSGNFASPNWPRNYEHHTSCTWTITVSKFKAIHLDFHHFDLGHQSSDFCDPLGDRLIITEWLQDGEDVLCLGPHVASYSTKSSNATITFISNGNRDAQGFRVFYKEEWLCNTVLLDDNGEFASPNWPHRYPHLTTCSWTIASPPGTRIRVRFNSVDLELHVGRNCDGAYDTLDVFDGNVSLAPTKIKAFCHKSEPTTVTSSGNFLYVQFQSDDRVYAKGFHAAYSFLYPKSTTHPTPTGSTITTAMNITEPRTDAPFVNDTNVTFNNTVQVIIQKLNLTEASLTAKFMEPTRKLPKETHYVINNTPLKPPAHGPPGDDIGIGYSTEVTPEMTEVDWEFKDAMWGVAASFLILFVAVLIVLFFVCRYYRRRLPKRRHVSNLPFCEENVSLYDKDNCTILNAHQDPRPCLDDEVDFPLPSPCDPPPDVAFENPVYEHRYSRVDGDNHSTCSRT
ncbi:hypothetical protein ScPMuIL_010593 [Solemya velum]